MNYFLVSVWTDEDWTQGSACEEFQSWREAQQGILDLLKDHPHAHWKLIEGKEIERRET
jgi:hypothetical protein